MYYPLDGKGMLYYNRHMGKLTLYTEVIKTRSKLIYERKKKEWTQQQLAIMLGVSKQMVSMIEKGRCSPSLKVANQLEDLFGIPQRELLDEHD